MITVQGPAWALTIATVLVLLMESANYLRTRLRDLRVRWSQRARYGTLPKSWKPVP